MRVAWLVGCVVALAAAPSFADKDKDLELEKAVAPPLPMIGLSATVVPNDAVEQREIFDAINATPVQTALGKCLYVGEVHVLVWIVVDHGKVTSTDAAGSGDRKLDACVAKAARAIELVSKPKGRFASAVILSSGTDAAFGPGQPPISAGTNKAPPLGPNHKLEGSHDDEPIYGYVGLGHETPRIRGPIDEEEIKASVGARHGAFATCYDTAKAATRKVAGTLRITFVVDHGRSDKVTITKKLDAALDACVVNELNFVGFPNTDDLTTVVYPFVFGPLPRR